MKILVTGCCGFIGSSVALRLLNMGYTVIGIDNFDDYYNIDIKQKRCNILLEKDNFIFEKNDIVNSDIINRLKPHKVCHLASKAGVRNSLLYPSSYVKNNIEGFTNLLDQAVKNNIQNFVYASSSSVYGLNNKVPFSETDNINSCNSPYAASKRSMEVFASTYNQLYNLPLIGLRFFTVYGPDGRPDMAPYKFIKSIINGEKFQKYGTGESMRDYTYIDDIVDGIIASLENTKNIKCELINLGNSTPVTLNHFIETCEIVTNKKAVYDQVGDQLGDVPITYADITKAKELLNYSPKVKLVDGLRNTYEWFIDNKIEN
mgnify:CR=1 FL=1